MKFITTATVHRTVEPGVARTKEAPGKAPVVKIIKTGTVVEITDRDVIKELTAAKAIRPYTEKDEGRRQQAAADSTKIDELTEEERAAANGYQAQRDQQSQEEDARRAKTDELNAALRDSGFDEPQGWGSMTNDARQKWLDDQAAETAATTAKSAELDKALKDSGLDTPEGWAAKSNADKAAWLEANKQQANPLDKVNTHAEADAYLGTAKLAKPEGWGEGELKTVAQKVTWLKAQTSSTDDLV